MTLKAAIDRLSAWVVMGVNNFGPDDLTGPVAEVDLPALVLMLSGTGGETLKPLGISADAGKVVVHVDHVLLTSGLGMGLTRERYYDALPHIDNYLAAVVEDLTLNGQLMEALTIADTVVGAVEFLGVLYYGVTFRHRWVLKVT